ncbi:MAG: HPr family phosphocarrier protein [Lachnospiraceae bacterium]|nr:HPr family phosphocarrier protein [Lachnospiraceae bacterium]
MIRKSVMIRLPNGLDAKPVALLVQEASKYRSAIYLVNGRHNVNAKSIMGMMTLGLPSGETVDVTADGQDEKEAIDNIEKYLSCAL